MPAPDARPSVMLRPLQDADVETLFAQQADPVAAEMAVFPSRDHDAFVEHLARLQTDPEVTYRVIEADGVVVGQIGSWVFEGHREVGYWIGREHWGKGYATAALRLLLADEPARPVHAGVAPGNVGSQRVLAKAGFVPEGIAESDGLLLYRLDA